MLKSDSKGSKIKSAVLISFVLFISFGFILGTSLADIQFSSKDNFPTNNEVLSSSNIDTIDNSINSQSLVDVTDHGAVGDGTTDDYQAIMDALDYAVNNNKDGVYFPSGTYGIGDMIWMNSKYNGISIISDNAVIKLIDGNVPRVIEIKGDSQGVVEDITIKGLTFDGNKDNLNVERFDNWCIHAWTDTNTVRNIHIEDVEVYDFSGNAVRLACSDSVVTNVLSHHNWGHGFNTGNTAKNILFENITSHNNFSPNNPDYGAGFDIHGGQNITLNDFMIRNNGFGIKTSTGSPTATIKNGVIKDNNWAGYRTSGEPTQGTSQGIEENGIS